MTTDRETLVYLSMMESSAQTTMRVTSFVFESKIFHVKGAYFFKSKRDGRVLLHLDLGDMQASVDAISLMNEFKIKPGSKDAELVELVNKSLNFVPRIVPGDNIPSEILNGSASWSITEAHLSTARNIVLLRLAQWVIGDQTDKIDYGMLGERLREPKIKSAIQKGFSNAARDLNLKDSEQVVQIVEQLSNELAYIEALRDCYRVIFNVRKILEKSKITLIGDKNQVENINRSLYLLKKPLNSYKNQFFCIDAQIIEIFSALKYLDRVVEFVRKTRDELHSYTLIWSEVQNILSSTSEIDRSSARKASDAIYRFAASNFLVGDEW